MIISSIKYEYLRYKKLAEKAIKQIPNSSLSEPYGDDGNSISILMTHIAGNLKSRFTDFFTSDGEKTWRNRDAEFEAKKLSRKELITQWDEG